jgi:hypothetical protein
VENCVPIVVNGIVVSTVGTYCEGTHNLDKPNHRLWATPRIVHVYKEHPTWPVVIMQDNDLFLRAIKNKSFAVDYLNSQSQSALPVLEKYGWTPDDADASTLTTGLKAEQGKFAGMRHYPLTSGNVADFQ